MQALLWGLLLATGTFLVWNIRSLTARGTKFMVHDRWEDVLFLHWRLPESLVPILREAASPFRIDRYEGSTWIGLVLLTERNVGPALPTCLRCFRSVTAVTHHGANVRTYVEGDGIHFFSLECDSRITSFGANIFGMPYTLSRIHRTFEERPVDECGEAASKSTCRNYPVSPRKYGFLSKRLTSKVNKYLTEKLHHTTKIDYSLNTGISELCSDECALRDVRYSFEIECEWEVKNEEREKDALSTFLVERYHVYTRKYRTDWRGTVHHDPWPLRDANVTRLRFQLDAYRPSGMRPILEHMASTHPSSAMFSSGVGPIEFDLLSPVGYGAKF